MRRLHDKVNIIPLIAKADTLTPDEREDFKKEIMREIETHKINIYEFPDHEDEEENRWVFFEKCRIQIELFRQKFARSSGPEPKNGHNVEF